MSEYEPCGLRYLCCELQLHASMIDWGRCVESGGLCAAQRGVLPMKQSSAELLSCWKPLREKGAAR